MFSDINFVKLVTRSINQVFATISGSLFAISDGMMIGWTSPYIPYLTSPESHIKTTREEADYLETIYLIGAICGIPITILCTNKLGRKNSLLLVTVIYMLSWIVVGVVNSMIYLFIVRFICGVISNMAYVSAPCYVAEIADPKIRGFLTSIIYIFLLTGCLIIYSVGPYTPFYTPTIIAVVVSLLQLATFYKVPESPSFLLSKNKKEEALQSIGYYKPYCDSQKELDLLQEAVKDQENHKFKLTDILKSSVNRKRILIMTVLQLCIDMCGNLVISMNIHTILDSAGSTYMNSAHAAILYSFLALPATIISSLQLDRFGRRTLLTASAILTSLCLLTLAGYLNFKAMNYDVTKLSWIPIVSIMIYNFVYKIGVELVPFVLMAEIFPSEYKVVGMTYCDALHMIGTVISVNIYQFLSKLGMFVPFYIFAGVAVFESVFTVFFVPETKGKSLEEIQALLEGSKRNAIPLQTVKNVSNN